MTKFTFSQWVEVVIAIVSVILYFAVADSVIAVAFILVLVVSLTALMVGKPLLTQISCLWTTRPSTTNRIMRIGAPKTNQITDGDH